MFLNERAGQTDGHLAAVGFSLGAYYALKLSVANPEHIRSVVIFNGTLRRAGRPVSFYRYSGTGHWFFEPDRSQAFNQAAARLAWDRTLTFLGRSSTL